MKITQFFFLLFLILLSAVLSSAVAQLAEPIGNFKSYMKGNDGIIIAADNANIRLIVYAPGIVRVRAVKGEFPRDFSYAVVQGPAKGFRNITEDKQQLVAETESLRIVVKKNPVRLSFYNRANILLNEDYADFGITWQGNEVTNYKKLFKDERFIGMGEKTGSLDRRGSRFTHWNTDDYAYETGADPLYASTPFFIGLHSNVTYGIFLDNSSKTVFDFGASSDNQFSSFSAPNGELNYYFFGGSSVAKILDDYTWLTGRMTLPPLWSLGYQQCRWSYYPDTEVLNLARTFREKKTPADVIYLDIHYMDEYKIFTWHPERFPRPKQMIDSLKAMGFHVVTIVDPGIKVEKGYFAYEEGVKNDYFAKYPNGEYYIGSVWPGRCHFPDFTKAAVREWWGKSFTHLTEPGVEGFWNDMNEPAAWGQSIPEIVEFDFDGAKTTLKEARNIYGMQMARSTFEGAKALLGGKRPFVLTRAAYSGIQRYSAIWTGDNVPTDEHMMLGVRLVNSMGLAGMAFAGPDIGGFSGDATPELFSRWLSIGAFTPFFRNHKQNGMKDQEPWAMGEQVEERSRKVIEQRYQLMPYIYSAFYQTSQTGIPIARSLAIDYTFDEKVYWHQYQHQYLFGDHILVAPVISTERYANVYLPSGGWYKMSDGKYYTGNQSVVVEAPLDNLPVFVREGAIIPMQATVQYTSQQSPETLNVHVYSGKQSTVSLYYEDDGSTYEFERGNYYKRKISFDPKQKEIVFHQTEGSFKTKFTSVKLILHNFDTISVSVNGRKSTITPDGKNEKLKSVMFSNSKNTITIRW